MEIVDRITNLAKSKGITQSFISSKLGVHRNWLSCVKRDNVRISEERLQIISDILGTTVAYLKGETDDPSPQKEKSPSEVDELLNDPLNKELWSRLVKMPQAKKAALLALIQDQESN
jgi:transcriptional regulator with XRE-family HTH domain